MSDDLVRHIRQLSETSVEAAKATAKTMNGMAITIKALEADKRALVEALEKISANSTDKEDPNLSSSDSFGNSDDVFSDGMRQADYYTAQIARETLAKHGGAR